MGDERPGVADLGSGVGSDFPSREQVEAGPAGSGRAEAAWLAGGLV